jgi:D-alanyl-lipoteichoic acid acyltransferase DltB (MBOAT superfamily)
MTLSRFLRDYLYIPLGGNRLGSARRYLNLMITMALGGLWHGAAWTFLIWGLLHGAFLLVNHAWRAVKRRPAIAPAVSGAITFIVVTFAWVFFRASDLPSAIGMAKAMLVPDFGAAFPHDLIDRTVLAFLAGCAVLVWLFPNTQEITRKWRPALEDNVGAQTAFIPLRWSPAGVTSLVTAVLLAACIMSLSNVGDFIYFKF